MEIPKPADFAPLQDSDAQAVREAVLLDLGRAGEAYLSDYSRRFGNILNVDDAATLFAPYNADRARFRVAVHPAATWIRDELFERALADRDRPGSVLFTAGSNAAGKSTAIRFTSAGRESLCILDSTFSNHVHARLLVGQALAAGKRVIVLYVDRPLDDAFQGMLERGQYEGRYVTIRQLIHSHEGAAETVCRLSEEFSGDGRVAFRFISNSSHGVSESSLALARPRDYTLVRKKLNEQLDNEHLSGRITEAVYRRVRG